MMGKFTDRVELNRKKTYKEIIYILENSNVNEIELLLANNSDNGTTLSFAIFNWLRWLIKLCSDM